jgi:drug/metabolite transporter (DMT)-like permease
VFARVLGSAPGPAYLWFSVIVFGAAASVVKILHDLGLQFPVDGRNAISFCNLLFAGNACATIVLYGVHRKSWNRETLKKVSAGEWCALIVLAFMANALAPGLFYLAIENTMVTGVVLVTQIEPPLLLLLSCLIFGDRFGWWSVIGSIVCATGVALTVFLQPMGGEYMIGKGEFFAAAAAVTYAFSTIIARKFLRGVPLGIFSVFRVAVGTVAFFIIALYLFGPAHFMDVGSPFLWQWMVIYGGIIVVSGQLAWDFGMRRSRSLDVSVATSFAPVAGVVAAILILNEQPNMAQFIGGGVLLAGILICLVGARRKGKQDSTVEMDDDDDMSDTTAVIDGECRTGFKGI